MARRKLRHGCSTRRRRLRLCRSRWYKLHKFNWNQSNDCNWYECSRWLRHHHSRGRRSRWRSGSSWYRDEHEHRRDAPGSGQRVRLERHLDAERHRHVCKHALAQRFVPFHRSSRCSEEPDWLDGRRLREHLRFKCPRDYKRQCDSFYEFNKIKRPRHFRNCRCCGWWRAGRSGPRARDSR